jgi:hypothetical protein
MKNIHILLTDKPSRLHEFGDIWFNHKEPTECFRNYNIYITSDEEIKEGEYGIDIRDSKVFKCERTLSNHYEFGVLQFQKSYCKKIILTTDKNLDGVQAIDDEFLEWFVKNPSCEEVEVEESTLLNTSRTYLGVDKYKIIIPSIDINSLNKQD